MDAQDRTTVVREHCPAKSWRKLLARAVAVLAILPAVAFQAMAQSPGPGAIVCWGSTGYCIVPDPPLGMYYREVNLEEQSSIALRSDGASLGFDPPPAPPTGQRYIHLAYGRDLGTAIRSDSQLVVWSYGAEIGSYAPQPGEYWVKSVCAAAPGTQFGVQTYWLALASQGAIACGGALSFGQCDVPSLPPGTRYVDVDAGPFHAIALRSDGVVVCWGTPGNSSCAIPTLPPGVTYVRVAAGGVYGSNPSGAFSAAVRSDGHIEIWGALIGTLLAPPGQRFVAVSAGRAHVLGLLDDGWVVGWGDNTYGQTNAPAPPPGMRFVEVSAGSYHSAARLASDCNRNGTLDNIEVGQGTSLDCDGNGFPDECDIAEGWQTDCDLNGIPDECDLASGAALDCNGNGIADSCDVAVGDCDANGIPDDCEPDCNGNGIPDTCDIASGASQDADLDGLPDECSALGTVVCSGDGSMSTCPCGNVGGLARGCGNSANAAGGRLRADGIASVAIDSAVLHSSGMPPAATVLYFQGTGLQNGGAGAFFGDGLHCAGGSIVRLGIEASVSGGSLFPGIGDPPISVQGQIPGIGGATRFYQVWYRDAAPFCTPSGFNLTNALQILWQQ